MSLNTFNNYGFIEHVFTNKELQPIRDEIEANGGIKLIYIDPPFDVGADFSTMIEIGNTEFEKAPTVLEEIAFRDTWGKGEDSFLAMIYERLLVMKDLLSEEVLTGKMVEGKSYQIKMKGEEITIQKKGK